MKVSDVNISNSLNLPVNYGRKKISNNSISFGTEKNAVPINNKKKWLTIATVCGFAICSPLIIKKIFFKSNPCNFIPDKFHLSMVESLDKLGIKVKPEALQSIISPNQFKVLIKNFKPEHFNAGLQISEKKAANMSLEEFYKNSVAGNFRVSLHTHSNFSDGKATVEEFLECARKYADKVAAMKKNDNLPPFTIALTDHDNINGCAEIIKIIVQNPEKYKNLKFVSGCEFSVRDGFSHYDITGLALNPFDKNLIKGLNSIAKKRIQVVEDFLDNQPLHNGQKITREHLIDVEKADYERQGKNGKRCIENAAGIVSVRHAIQYYYKTIGKEINKDVVNQLGDKEILPIETVVNLINQNGGFASLTHPIKSFWKYIGDDALKRLKNMGVRGIEVNHQYTPSKVTKLGKINNVENADELFNKLVEKYAKFAGENDMFMSGGTDCHEKQIFSRSPKITSEFLERKILG